MVSLPALARIDRISVLYLVLPLFIFVVGWIEWWASIPLVILTGYLLRPLFVGWKTTERLTWSRSQLSIVIGVSCVWTLLGGTSHLFFANFDWPIRDAVLRDLVVGAWPVGYGTHAGHETILRAPLGYYLPAALLGKWTTLQISHIALTLWTGIGVALFLTQVLSLLPSRWAIWCGAAAIIVLFGGLDILGGGLNGGPHFRAHWNIASHLEWWAIDYQYSSMTTQLFWVPNHALGGWLMAGLLCRNERNASIDCVLPIAIVALALWSPLTAIGVLPFVLLRFTAQNSATTLKAMLHPRVWGGAAVVGVAVACYLFLDASRVPKELLIGSPVSDGVAMDIARQLQFFLLEAGLVGLAVLALRRSREVMAALVVLLLLPAISFGAANDFVMRASIPSIAVLAIATCLALLQPSEAKSKRSLIAAVALFFLLSVGAVTALQEIVRSVLVPRWSIDTRSTLISAACGEYPAHYVAALPEQRLFGFLRAPHPITTPSFDRSSCANPAIVQMMRAGVLKP